MKLKIYLKTGSQDEAVNLGKKILKDVKNGECPTWGFREIAAPNMTSKPVICHDVSSGQYLDEGKDVCFGMHLDGADLIIIPGLLTNWCAPLPRPATAPHRPPHLAAPLLSPLLQVSDGLLTRLPEQPLKPIVFFSNIQSNNRPRQREDANHS